MSEPFASIRDLSKSYGATQALSGFDLELEGGEIHAICGENGAGKSTLIKILSGVVTPDRGDIRIQGRGLQVGSVNASESAGVSVVHQESTLFPDLSASENLAVGSERKFMGRFGLDRKRMRAHAVEALTPLEPELNVDLPVRELSVTHRQMIALARALQRQSRLLILDEPTASLSASETETLLRIVQDLRGAGITILYVSHRLEEIFEIADRVTTLRDGEWVATQRAESLTRETLIHQMVGREVEELTQRHAHPDRFGDTRLKVNALSRRGVFSDVSLELRAGEILGLGGLIGAGRSELARAIFGIDRFDSGAVWANGKRLPPGKARAAMAAGIAFAPEDRQSEGLALPMTIQANLSAAILNRLTQFGLIQSVKEREFAQRATKRLHVRFASLNAPANSLSGGNQQKLVLGKWLGTNPSVLILDEPTRGIDVGAKAEIHRLIRELAESGLATLLISSDMTELLSLSDRILVLKEGQVSGELPGDSATSHEILKLALPEEPEATQ